MANYTLYGNSSNLFDVRPGRDEGVRWIDQLLYVSATEFGITNTDGSQTFYLGSNIVWDFTTNSFQSGTVTRIVHFANGQFIDELNGINLSLFGDTDYGYSYAGLFYGDDVLDARNRVDYLTLSASLNGYGGNDLIYGGNGADQLIGGDGDDTVTGAAGNDFIDGGAGSDVLTGDAGNDKIVAGDGDDSINGGNGNDNIIGGGGGDTIIGGTGSDRIQGGMGADDLDAGSGNDVIYGGHGSDAIDGNMGTDTAVYSFSRSDLHWHKTDFGFLIFTDEGIDTLTGIERIGLDDGTYGWDAATNNWVKLNNTVGVTLVNPSGLVRGTANADSLVAPAGALSSDPLVYRGYGGDDTILAGSTDTLIFGGAGNDTISATQFTSAIHRVFGEGGNDTIEVSGALSFADGGSGNDTIMVFSGKGLGGDGNDVLSGGSESMLWGGNGDDTLRNAVTATGDAGADTFIYEFKIFGGPIYSTFGWGDANVTDFELGIDHVEVGALGSGIAPSLALTQTDVGYVLTATLNGKTSTITFHGVTTSGLTLDDIML